MALMYIRYSQGNDVYTFSMQGDNVICSVIKERITHPIFNSYPVVFPNSTSSTLTQSSLEIVDHMLQTGFYPRFDGTRVIFQQVDKEVIQSHQTQSATVSASEKNNQGELSINLRDVSNKVPNNSSNYIPKETGVTRINEKDLARMAQAKTYDLKTRFNTEGNSETNDI